MKNAARPFYKSNDRTHETRPGFALRPIAYFFAGLLPLAAGPFAPITLMLSLSKHERPRLF